MTRPPLQGILLGTADATPQADRGQSATFVQTPSYRFLVDVGSGALQKLVRTGHSPSEIDAIFLTHAHLDHLGDLLFYFFGIGAKTIPRSKPLTLYGSAQTLAYVRGMYDVFSHWTARDPSAVVWIPVDAGQCFCVGDLVVRTSSVHHTESSLAYRWETPCGKSLAMTGDTGVHAPLIDFVQGADVLIVECGSDPASPVETHLTPQQLVDFLDASRPKRAYIVHCASTIDRVELDAFLRASYDGMWHLADDCDPFVIST